MRIIRSSPASTHAGTGRVGLASAGLAAVVAFLGILGAPRTTAAQDTEIELLKPRARQGYYIGGGPRLISWVVDDDDIGSLGGTFGFGASLRLGQKVNDWLGLGIAFEGGAAGNADWDLAGGGLKLEIQVQPWADVDLAFRGGAGVLGLSVSRIESLDATDDDPEGTFGSLFTLGASYEIFPWYDAATYESGGAAFSFFVEGQVAPGLGGITTYGAVVGFEFTWWSGLNRNKLDLPVDAAFSK